MAATRQAELNFGVLLRNGPMAMALVVAVAVVACRRSPPERREVVTVGSGAVSVPAPSLAQPVQPDVVTHASEVVAGPPVAVSTGVDGAALRKQHVERLKNDRSPVTVLKGDSAFELGDRLCKAVVPARPKWTPILIKPNICGFDGFKNVEKTGDDGVTGRITDVEFVRGILRCLKARGHESITIAEGCGNSHTHWQKAIQVSGFEAMAREEAVGLVAMDDDGVFDKTGNLPGKPLAVYGIANTHVKSLLMPKILAETLQRGLFISVPKLKAHRYSVVSLGIKGMQGTVMRSDASPAYNQKWRMHEELNHYLAERRHKQPENRAEYVASLMTFAERMVDVLEISTPDVVLIDGAPATSGDGFQRIRRVPGKIAIGGTNPVLVDRVGSEYLGLWDNAALGEQLGGHRSSPLIEVAAQRYGVNWKSLTLVGDGVELLREPRPVYYKAIAPFTLDGGKTILTHPAESVQGEASLAAMASALPSSAGSGESTAPASVHSVEADAPGHATATTAPAPSAPAAASALSISVVAPVPSAAAAASAQIVAGAPGGRSSADPGAVAPPAAHARRTRSAPKLDGQLDPLWQAAVPVSWNTDYAGNDTGVTTRARFLWDSQALYALFELWSTDLNTDQSYPIDRERIRLYQEDCVEVFLAPDRDRPKHYFEIELGPFGHWFDVEIDHDRRLQRIEWSSGVELGTQRAPASHLAVIEARFTAAEIVGVLKGGASLPLALYRMEGSGPRKYLAWRPPRTKKPNFHVPEGFGTLVLDP